MPHAQLEVRVPVEGPGTDEEDVVVVGLRVRLVEAVVAVLRRGGGGHGDGGAGGGDGGRNGEVSVAGGRRFLRLFCATALILRLSVVLPSARNVVKRLLVGMSGSQYLFRFF